MRLPNRFIPKVRVRPSPSTAVRCFASSSRSFQPTALHRAQKAADVKAHPESTLTQEKLPDKEHNRHWSEENATPSEADVHADHEAKEEALKQAQKKNATEKS